MRLKLTEWSRTSHELALEFDVGDVRLSKIYRYPDLDLIDLEKRYGRDLMERLYFHIAAFEAMPLASIKPDTISLGLLAHFQTQAFQSVWRTVFLNVSAQWRYENNLTEYRGPVFEDRPTPSRARSTRLENGPIPVLNFTGGGKDSLVSMKLLERGKIPFSAFSYSHPTYGPAQEQHALIERLSDVTAVRRRHWLEVEDEFWSRRAEGIEHRHGIRSRICAETPAAIMGAIPVALAHGYQYMSLGHERSADSLNLVWQLTGEEINHQWGKSLEAELLIDNYIRRHLISGLTYFSLLKPIHDVVIFGLLNDDLPAVARTHSCNVRKPWCCRCAKCAYVWLNFMAWLPEETVRPMFAENLFEVPDNETWFRQLLGLAAHRPFECVGEIAESRLAFALYRSKGIRGSIADTCAAELPHQRELPEHYFTVHQSESTIPTDIASVIFPQMERAAERARSYAESALCH